MKTKVIFMIVVLSLLAVYLMVKDRLPMTKWLPADAVLPDNSRYYGEIKDGFFAGQGALISADGSVYSGSFERGLMSGEGKLKDNRGLLYEGEFKDGMMHGKGSLKLENGSHFQGQFDKGKITEGVHMDKDGNRYEGTFTDWLLHGEGTLTTSIGYVYSGHFESGILNGQGEITYDDGTYYKGDVSDWSFEGNGELIDEEGNHYTGEFMYGQYHGQGTLVLATPIDGVQEISGEWSYGFIDDDPRYADAKGAEAAAIDDMLYNQNTLLAETLERVETHSEEQIDLYFVGMAAHSESVFYKEIASIKNYFADQFNASNKIITLVNHPTQSTENPLLTQHALNTVLDGLVSKIDVDQDILFLYLTSHGTDKEISVKYPGLNLSSIEAEPLGDVLNNSPIKWKVIMISACYSGSFIPFLKDEHHLVMTASRADRTSFGCGEDSEMTYFGKAMFEEALPNNESFITAFEAAKEIIHEWETVEVPQSEHSEPQIFIGEKIEAHLQKWRAQINQ